MCRIAAFSNRKFRLYYFSFIGILSRTSAGPIRYGLALTSHNSFAQTPSTATGYVDDGGG